MLKRFEAFSSFVLPWVVMAFLAVEILLPKIPLPFLQMANTANKVRYDDFAVAVAIFAWGIGFWWAKKRFWTTVSNQTIFFFWFVTAVSLLSALVLTRTTYSAHVALLNWIRRVEYMSVFFVGFAAVKDRVTMVRSLIVLIGAGAATIFYALGQIYFHWCSISTTNREFAKGECVPLTTGTRPNATFGNQAEFAIFLGFVIPIIIALFFAANKVWQKVVLAAVFLMYFGMTIMTQARWPFVAAAATIVALFWLYGQKKLLAAFVVLAAIGIPLVGHNLLVRYITTAETLVTPVQTTTNKSMIPIDQLIYQTTTAGGRTDFSGSAIPGQEDLLTQDQYNKAHPQQYLKQADPALEAQRSTAIRFQSEWPAAIRAFLRNPLLGSGYSSLADQYGNTASDNDYLRSLGEVGLFGTFAFGLIVVVITRMFLRFLKENTAKKSVTRNIVIGFSAALAGFFINAVFIDVFESSKLATVFWLLFGAVIALIITERQRDNA